MIKTLQQNIFLFILLVLLQVGVLNNIQLGSYLNPYMYVLFILLLPINTPNWLVLVVSFILGLIIDMFADTIGMHASATVFMGFLRPLILQAITNRDNYDSGTSPRIHYFGFFWFLKYTLVLVFSHHLFLFTVEMFNFHSFHLVLWRTVLSTLFTSLLVILSQYVIYRK
ncbi:MAG TPA: rod shape-determining protein MreD [Marinilabiliales bacterium]|nr:rod shape-determining protein MreD [Marinilabiliales bacterium]